MTPERAREIANSAYKIAVNVAGHQLPNDTDGRLRFITGYLQQSMVAALEQYGVEPDPQDHETCNFAPGEKDTPIQLRFTSGEIECKPWAEITALRMNGRPLPHWIQDAIFAAWDNEMETAALEYVERRKEAAMRMDAMDEPEGGI